MIATRMAARVNPSVVDKAIRIAAAALVMTAAAAFAAEPIVGRASVIDGDTIDIHGQRIRLHGIDAPESRQLCTDKAGEIYRCGQAAAMALEDYLAASRPTHCDQLDTDRNGRIVAECVRADGASVNAWMVRQGHALDWPRYSKGAYAVDQQEAQGARLGMWQGAFVEPWEYRRQKRRPGT